MGDKGGKKDKEKHKQQQAKKHQDEQQRKQLRAVTDAGNPRVGDDGRRTPGR